jgi:two-component sensor histidine kinase
MNPVPLDNNTHRDLRIVTARGAAWGDDVMTTPVFLSEFRSAQASYPIVFQPADNGPGMQPVALLGLRSGENLFLDAHGWDATYIPLALERGPFMIGRTADQLMIHVDIDSPRIGRGEGEPVFLPHGATTEYLERVNAVLGAIHHGVETMPAFVAALLRHELLESFVVDIEAADGSQNRLAGFHTIHEERLAALDAASIAELHGAGYLSAIYMVLASTAHLRDLIERYNKSLAQRPA